MCYTEVQTMAKIIPIRDLRKGAEISEFVKTSGEPIFVTRNGYGDMVILSMESYEKQFSKNFEKKIGEKQ